MVGRWRSLNGLRDDGDEEAPGAPENRYKRGKGEKSKQVTFLKPTISRSLKSQLTEQVEIQAGMERPDESPV